MHSRFTHILMLIAGLLATGVQWDVVQVLAWGRMFVLNARASAWSDALDQTFSVDRMCRACHAVQEAKQDEDGKPQTMVTPAAREPLLFQRAAEIIIAAPGVRTRIIVEPRDLSHERSAPPTPPPRALV